MKVNIYAIYDSKAKAYLQPWFAPNSATAFRNIEKAMRNPQSPFVDFPADFNLFELGVFDDESGIIETHSAPQNHGNFLQFVPADPVDVQESGSLQR